MIINIKNKDIYWNYINIILSLSSNIVFLPFLIKYLSVDLLGVWYIFIGIGNIVLLFDFGFNPTIARFVSYSYSGAQGLNKIDVDKIEKKSTPNYELLYFIIETAKVIYLIIAIIALILLLTIGTYYIERIITDVYDEQILLAWIIYAFSIFFNIYIGYYSISLRGIGDVAGQNKINSVSKLVSIFLSILGLILGYGILSLAIANFVGGILLRYLSKYNFYYKNNIKKIFNKLEYSSKYSKYYVFSRIWHNAWRDGLVSITMYLNTQFSTLICASFLSLYETGIYSFCLQIVNIIITISYGLYLSYQPRLQSAYINRDIELQRNIYSIVLTVFYLISILSAILFIFVGKNIIIYIKDNFYIDSYIFIILFIHRLFIQRHTLSASFISNMNNLPYFKSFILFSLMGTILTYIVMKFIYCDIYLLIIIPMFVQFLYNNWKWNIVVNKYLKTNEYKLLKNGANMLYKLYINKK